MRLPPIAAVAGLAGLVAACAATPPAARDWLRRTLDDERAARPFAPASTALPGIDQRSAYALQRAYVARKTTAGERVAGFRGGLMSVASMRSRNVTTPLAGVLFADGRVRLGNTVSLCGYRRAAFEMKLGFVFARAITTLPDEVSLRAQVAHVVPVIDLPDIGYRDPDHYGAIDMIAANISAARYIVGREALPNATDLDAQPVTLRRDRQVLAHGTGRDSLGGQWRGLRVLVGAILASKRHIRAGDLVMTGKIGDKGWLLPGAYEADYATLGRYGFTVVPCRGAR